MPVFHVDQDATLVAFVAAQLPDMKKGTLKDRLRDGAVLVNGQPQTRATFAVRPGDVVELRGAASGAARGPRGAPHVTILYDDRDIVIIDKPSGLLTVSAAAGRDDDTALSVTGAQLGGPRGRVRLWPCHRLDRGTSGVLALAKRREIQEAVMAGWGDAEKIYVAVVSGVVMADDGIIDAALYENPQTLSVRVSTQPNARPARTAYRVLARGARRTLVELALDTGRKHQIRVHLLHIGHPIVGDDRYGDGDKRQRLCLHARQLSLTHPTTRQRHTWSSPEPASFRALVETA